MPRMLSARRRFLKTPEEGRFVIDRAKAEEDAKFDGVFVLRTNTSLAARSDDLLQAVVEGGARFSNLEEPFRDATDLSQARRDHSRPCVVQLSRAGPEEGAGGPRRGAGLRLFLARHLADLDSLTETEDEQDGKRFLLRSAPRPAASLALRAAGVALPPTVRQIDAA